MKKIIRNIALAALVASPFSQSALAGSFSAFANGYTDNVQQAQLGKGTNHVQPVNSGAQLSTVPEGVWPNDYPPHMDQDVIDELTCWFDAAFDSILSYIP
jgi:hypothetical protein